MTTQLIAQIDVFPDGGMVRIDAPGYVGPDPDIAGGGPQFGGGGTFVASLHSIRVCTMSGDTAEIVG